MRNGIFPMCGYCSNYCKSKCKEDVVSFEILPTTDATDCVRTGKFKKMIK